MKIRLNRAATVIAASAFILTPAFGQTRSEQPRTNPPGNPNTPNPTQPNNPNQPNQPNNPNQPRDPNQPNQPPNPNQPNQPVNPNDPNRPILRDPDGNEIGESEERSLLNRRQRMFRLQDDQAIGQLNEVGQRLMRFEARMRESNERLLKQLGQARQMQGERRFDAMAMLLQDMLQEQAQLNQYLADLRTSMTGDIFDPNDPNHPANNPGNLEQPMGQSPAAPRTNPGAPRGPGETPLNPNQPNQPNNPATPQSPPGGTNPNNPRPQGPPR